MTVDLRAIVATDLGICVSGDVGANHISDRSGLVMVQGRLQFDGIVTPARGTPIRFLVAQPQRGTVTRFPKPLWVIRSVAYPEDQRSEIEVGCRLTLMQNRKEDLKYLANNFLPSWWNDIPEGYEALFASPIQAQKLLEFCLSKIGVTIAPGTHQLQFSFLRPEIDLSTGYVQIIGQLCRSEGCFGRIRPDGKFEIIQIKLDKGQRGPVLRRTDLVSMEPITAGADPPDKYKVTYSAFERRRQS